VCGQVRPERYGDCRRKRRPERRREAKDDASIGARGVQRWPRVRGRRRTRQYRRSSAANAATGSHANATA